MNVANALGVAVLLGEFGVGADEIARGLESFRGVVRRQELIGEARGVAVVDDFAHHPTAIRATLAAIAERFAGRRILAAFEPRSNTARRNVFQSEFAAAFDRAARVYLAPVYFKDNDPIAADGRLSVEDLAAGYRAPRAGRVRVRVNRRYPGADAGRRAPGRRRARHVERPVRQSEGAAARRAQDFRLAARARPIEPGIDKCLRGYATLRSGAGFSALASTVVVRVFSSCATSIRSPPTVRAAKLYSAHPSPTRK